MARTYAINRCTRMTDSYLESIKHSTEMYKHYKDAHDSCMKSETNKDDCRSYAKSANKFLITIDSFERQLVEHEFECELKLGYLKQYLVRY